MPEKLEGEPMPVTEIVLATHNPGKVVELQEMLDPFGIQVIGAAELNLPEPVEDGDSFVANATIKAVSAAKSSGKHALADDSGLCLPALGGWPGVDTAEWTKRGPEGLAEINNRLAAEAKGDHRAEAVCVLVMAWPDGSTRVFEGRVNGQWVWPPRGTEGFGYDPTFAPDADSQGRTYAEMGKLEKGRISHRSRAFTNFMGSDCLQKMCA